MTIDPATLARLDKLAAAIRACDDPRRATGEWKQVYRLLQKAELPPDHVTGVVGMRDLAGLDELLDRLRHPEAPPPAGDDVPDEETCKRALRAFRKRLALSRLDDQSRIGGHGPLTQGSDSRVSTAIVAPSEWPDAVWQELVRQGKLRYLGRRLYELARE